MAVFAEGRAAHQLVYDSETLGDPPLGPPGQHYGLIPNKLIKVINLSLPINTFHNGAQPMLIPLFLLSILLLFKDLFPTQLNYFRIILLSLY